MLAVHPKIVSWVPPQPTIMPEHFFGTCWLVRPMASDLQSNSRRSTFTLSALFLWTTGIGITLGLLMNFGPGILLFPIIGFIAFAAAHAHEEKNVVSFLQLTGAVAICVHFFASTGLARPTEITVVVDSIILAFGGWLAYRSTRSRSWPTRILGTFVSLIYITICVTIFFQTMNF